MRITKLQTEDFQGLAGRRQMVFPDKITVLAAPNGSGKTSILNAIRFGLTGDLRSGKFITDGKSKCDVGLNFDNGCQIIREAGVSTPPRQWFNRKAMNKKEVDEKFEKEMGVSIGSVRITTASEVVGNMKPQDLGDFMLKFIPQTLDTESVLKLIPNVTPGMKDFATRTLPTGTFGIDEIDRFYDVVYALRRDAKKRRAGNEAVMKSLGSPVVPAEAPHELMDKLKNIRAGEQMMAAYEAKKAAYDKSVQHFQSNKVLLGRLEQQYAALKDVEYTQEEADRTVKMLDEALARREAAFKTYSTLENAQAALKKAISTLDTSGCPLSRKLVCTTDKSGVRSELMGSLKQTTEALDSASKALQAADCEVLRLKKLQQDLTERYRKVLEKTSLANRIAQIRKDSAPLKEPVKPTIHLENEAEIRAKLEAWNTLGKIDTLKKKMAAESPSVEDLEALTAAFAPKGVVKMSITSSYIKAFEASCNTRAGELKPGMSMKFDTMNGVTPLLDVNGSGHYLSYAALSGGEKIYMIFLLLDMFNKMCGLRMLFLDELSVLDGSNFSILLDVLKNHTDDYDQIFLTTVDHDDIMKRIAAEGITCVKAA